MRAVEKASSCAALFLIGVAVALLWLVDWMLGLGFSLFIAAVMAWYLQTKRRGDKYLKEVARGIKCGFLSRR